MDSKRRAEIKMLARRVVLSPESVWPEPMTALLMAEAMCNSAEERELLDVEVMSAKRSLASRNIPSLPPPPERNDFRTQEQFEEALGRWRDPREGSGPSPSRNSYQPTTSEDEISQLLNAADEPTSGKTFADLLEEGIPHKGGLAQIADALPELLGFTTPESDVSLNDSAPLLLLAP